MQDDVVKKKIYWWSLVSDSLGPCLCIVIISLPSILHRTQCFMNQTHWDRLSLCQRWLDQKGDYVPVHTVLDAVSRFTYQSCLTSGVFYSLWQAGHVGCLCSNLRRSVKSLVFGLLGYWVIIHIYPHTLLVFCIHLVTLYYLIYNLLLGFSISL